MQKGTHHTAETRAKRVAQQKLMWQNPVYRQHMSEVHKGKRTLRWRGGPKASKERNKSQIILASKLYRQKNKEKIADYNRNFVNRNKELYSFYSRQRHYRKKTAAGDHSFEQWEALKAKYFNICLCCKKQEPFIKLTEDHILPLSLGGSNDISNIQPLCGSCNSAKNTKTIDYTSSKNICSSQ